MKNETTHPSLLRRIQDPSDQEAWSQFEARYRELILRYCRKRGLSSWEAEDVRQMVMLGLFQSLPGFRYDSRRGQFRGYLYRTVQHAILRLGRPRGGVTFLDPEEFASVPDGSAARSDEEWDREWMDHHLRLAMETVRATFHPRSVAVFDRLVEGGEVDQVAAEFRLSEEAVYKIKYRIRDRLRQLIAQQIREP